MLSGECATAGFLFLEFDGNPSSLQQGPNVFGPQPRSIVVHHQFALGRLYLNAHDSVNPMCRCDSRPGLFIQRPFQPESDLYFGHKLGWNFAVAFEFFK
jgi:hypothetical protein